MVLCAVLYIMVDNELWSIHSTILSCLNSVLYNFVLLICELSIFFYCNYFNYRNWQLNKKKKIIMYKVFNKSGKYTYWEMSLDNCTVKFLPFILLCQCLKFKLTGKKKSMFAFHYHFYCKYIKVSILRIFKRKYEQKQFSNI